MPERRVGKRGGKLACDQCKFRKTKCTLESPCHSCAGKGFECTYSAERRKRKGTGRRVLEIHRQQQQGAHVNSSPPAPRDTVSDQSHGTPFGQSIDFNQPQSQDKAHTYQDEGLSGIGDVEYWLPNVIPRGADLMEDSNPWLASGESWPFFDPMSLNELGPLEPPWHPVQFDIAGSENSAALTTGSVLPQQSAQGAQLPNPNGFWPSSVTEQSLLPWVDIFFARLQLTLPVLDQLSLYRRIILREHLTNPQFAAMILSLCAVSLTQPVWIHERESSSSRAIQAKNLMEDAARISSVPGVGEDVSVETILTSFFLFACLYGSNQNNEAWLRLREAIEIAVTLGVHKAETYKALSPRERLQRLRIFLVLAVTERGYALKKHRGISFVKELIFSANAVIEVVQSAADGSYGGAVAGPERDVPGGLEGLLRMVKLFDTINHDILSCWNQACESSRGRCSVFDSLRAVSSHREMARVVQLESHNREACPCRRSGSSRNMLGSGISESDLDAIQWTDYMIAHQWLSSRLWALSLNHQLLGVDYQYRELTYRYALEIAESTVQLCSGFSLGSMEAHGIGLIERLHDIGVVVFQFTETMVRELGLAQDRDRAMGTAGAVPDFSGTSRAFEEWEDYGRVKKVCGQLFNLLATLRGGSHPYLTQYVKRYTSLPSVLAMELAAEIPRFATIWQTVY